MIIYKHYLKRLLILFFVLLVCILCMNYLVDPYGYNVRNGKFIKNLTMFNKPHVTNARVNSKGYYYLIGSSRMARINPLEIEKMTGMKTHNIKIDGATLIENTMLATEVKIRDKYFIYSFDVFSSNQNRQQYEEIKNRVSIYKNEMSNNKIFGKFFNSDITIRTLQHLIKKLKNEKLDKQHLEENDRLSSFSLDQMSIESGVLSNREKANFSNFTVYSDELINKLAKLGNKNDIFIIFPKYAPYYALFSKHQDIEQKYFSAVRTLVNNTEAQVWSFYGNNVITQNLNNFIDNGWHFKPKVGKKIFEEIFTTNHKKLDFSSGVLLTKSNLESYLIDISSEIEDTR
jgi:hypothetical protein